MEITIGDNAGFCYGVKRAVEGAKRDIKEKKQLYCLGEIVHNRQVIEELEQQGLQFIDNIDEIIKKNDTNTNVIIRAHGVSKNVYLKARENKINLIDYTCPNVLKIHKITEEYSKKDFFIFLVGMENHPEIIGTKSYCGNNYRIISQDCDIQNCLKDFELSGLKNILVIAQTTFSLKKFDEIKSNIEKSIKNDVKLVVKNTICLATELRQKETEKLSKEADSMIIIGGKNSSNTKKLFEIAQKNCKKTILIETKHDLKNFSFTNIRKLGIMAGASTPQESINSVVEFCGEKSNKNS